ncbi:hypothetical protein [Mycobacterium sp. shizuoka-1]|nr:hypothetical protein [Mycobacterium sp. shizuoka-1]
MSFPVVPLLGAAHITDPVSATTTALVIVHVVTVAMIFTPSRSV